MRMTKRKKAILELLSITDKEHLFFTIGNTGLFTFSCIYESVYKDGANSQSKIVSLYRTLRTMVKDGLLIERKELIEGTMGGMNYWQKSWHIPSKIDFDLKVIKDWEAGLEERSEKAWDNILKNLL
ncbi:hypothetical protein [Thiomicrospira cyclica]|uniref:Uncharacterized protein n=1 Tax=Thiomicrospira cyclica (strain DSM 14477 / JCM 11371 / ALM1) TaxID=717773 RepID=F6DCF8_THICA|nr:hypothetical protein [Thiomicrospira cyclica]AEG31544.1 hypothetical protein Thicy_0772 [Thiomicrospira cyclica ALM1]